MNENATAISDQVQGPHTFLLLEPVTSFKSVVMIEMLR